MRDCYTAADAMLLKGYHYYSLGCVADDACFLIADDAYFAQLANRMLKYCAIALSQAAHANVGANHMLILCLHDGVYYRCA